ncbi:spermidine synthase [Salsipaludibacter albus]|uniref:spermidine synthase n=1 Tax=Salsipaludibacter albus TaxID=2849650 RepID=UPI001EE3B5F8|nr:spermidine synthase [Salsipaludibacter albus]MBY5162305.1 spermidine synthase [Salsipaludibacter albus]
MGALLEELARRDTPSGLLTLRRRVEPSRQVDVFEVKLGDEFLMSSLFTIGEEELARLGLDAVEGDDLDVVVGGLGLGYTAATALEDDRVSSLLVVEAVDTVIDWHRQALLPDVGGLATDPRTRFVHGDFFAMAADAGWDPDTDDRRVDAVLLDVDHTPRHHLHPDHAAFYTPEGLASMARFLRPDGVFALWSDDPPDDDFVATAREVFDEVTAHVVSFANFLTGGESANTVYVAR